MKCDSCGTVEATKWVGGDCEPCWLQRAREKVLERELAEARAETQAQAETAEMQRHRAKAAEFDLANWKRLSRDQDKTIETLEAKIEGALLLLRPLEDNISDADNVAMEVLELLEDK